jgi:hypothetical protein
MNIIQILDSPIAFHRCLARITGSAAAGLLLSQAIYWRNVKARKGDASEWFYKTTEEWMDETMLGPNEFKTARNACKPFLDHEVRGIPAKCYYRINEEALKAKLDEEGSDVTNKFERNVQTGLNETCKQESTNRSNYSTETTAESTSESTKGVPRTGASALAPRGKRVEATPEARDLVSQFAQAYQAHTGLPYGVREPDSKFAATLLVMSGRCVAETTAVVVRAWKQGGWWGKRVKTIKGFVEHWNEIQAEVVSGPIADHTSIRQLEERIAKHPANWSYIRHDPKKVTPELRDEYKALKARLEALTNDQ